jgi:predicted esterase
LESPIPQRFNIETRIQNEALLAGDCDSAQIERMVILLHGYGESAQIMMDRFPDLQCLNGTAVASLEALHPIYLPTGKTGSSWMTSYQRDASIQNNLAYLESAIATLKAKRSWKQLILIGYSQGAQMAMRTAHFIDADQLVAIGSEAPPELKNQPKFSSKCFKVSLMRGKKDMAYPAHKFQEDIQWYQNAGHTVRTGEWPGGHVWSEQSSARVTEQVLESQNIALST